LAPVLPRGGAPLVVRGSHLAMMDLSRKAGASIRSADARSLLAARSSWLRALFSKTDVTDRVSRFMESDGDLCGFPVRVEELTGEPGDLILMHPGMLHAASPNVLDRPRMMLVQSIVRRDWTKAFAY
jgi:ectoine hydroxylase-related dioxygenase (phytanoyl-CoA dioxygenase family)